jgi:hypothetical protein
MPAECYAIKFCNGRRPYRRAKRLRPFAWKHDRSQGEGSLSYLVYRRLKGSDYFPGSGCPRLASRCGRCRTNLCSSCWCQECISMRSAEQRSKTEYISNRITILRPPCWVTICHAQGLPAHDILQCLIDLSCNKG